VLSTLILLSLQLMQAVKRLEQLLASVSEKKSVAFSSVGQSQAADLLRATQLTLLNGRDNELRAARARRTAAVPNFVWPPATPEADGTPAALEHMRTRLEQLGVTFGWGGYAMVDTHHRNTSLKFNVGTMLFKGGMDGAIVPYDVAPLSAARHARVVFELKTRSADEKDLGDSAIGQCIAELLGVNAQAVYPCILILTDGTVCDVLRLRGASVTRWAGVPLGDALAYVADFLMSESSPIATEEPVEPRARGDAATAATLQKLHGLLPKAGAALAAAAEQFESLLGADDDDDDECAGAETEAGAARRVALATQLAAQWCHALEPQELPQHVRHLFA
jgi:hypothetical protein